MEQQAGYSPTEMQSQFLCLLYEVRPESFFRIMIVYLRGYVEPWNMPKQQALSRQVSRLNVWSKRGNVDAENTYTYWENRERYCSLSRRSDSAILSGGV